MNRSVRNKIGLAFVFCMAITVFALQAPTVCRGEDLTFEFSPNNITLSAERLGEIRILTGMRYSFFTANEGTPFLYFNECSPSVENIKASRDSLGNLILRFSLEDLLALEECLINDFFNKAKLVITLNNGTEYIGYGEIYLNAKASKK